MRLVWMRCCCLRVVFWSCVVLIGCCLCLSWIWRVEFWFWWVLWLKICCFWLSWWSRCCIVGVWRCWCWIRWVSWSRWIGWGVGYVVFVWRFWCCCFWSSCFCGFSGWLFWWCGWLFGVGLFCVWVCLEFFESICLWLCWLWFVISFLGIWCWVVWRWFCCLVFGCVYCGVFIVLCWMGVWRGYLVFGWSEGWCLEVFVWDWLLLEGFFWELVSRVGLGSFFC